MLYFQTLPKLRIFKEVGVQKTVRFDDSKKTQGGRSYTYTFNKPSNISAIPGYNKRLRDGHHWCCGK